MTPDRYAGLSPADRLEAQRRDEAEVERVRRLNEPIRAAARADAKHVLGEIGDRVSREESARLVRLAGQPPAPEAPSGPNTVWPSLEDIEAKRLELAKAGKAHGYDALGGASVDHPFPGKRSTIVRRYRGRPSPGTAIAGVCDEAPPHQH